MQPHHYQQMAAIEDRHWWFVGTRDIICDVVRLHVPIASKILDLGCGTGYTSERLSSLGYNVTSVDNENAAIEAAQRRGLQNVHIEDAAHLTYPDESFEGVVCLDVLEHIQQHEAAVQQLRRVLKKDGCAIIAVPAWPGLFGPHDQALGHFRRYTKKQLRNLLENNGLCIERLTYYNSLLSIPITAVRLFHRIFNTPPRTDVHNVGILNASLGMILRSEKFLLRATNFPYGISLLAIARSRA